MKRPIISVSGLRGVIGESLSPELVMRFAIAMSRVARAGALVLTRDGRATGGMLADAVRAALQAVGRRVIDAGIAATPTTGVLVRRCQAAGGIQISASHNPPQYNGLKLFDHTGRVFPAESGDLVIEQFERSEVVWADYASLGSVRLCEDSTVDHLEAVMNTVDADQIREASFRVLLDANHGAGSLLGSRLLRELNCHATLVGGTPDGQFSHPPEPTAENLQEVGQQVAEAQADVGFCQDPDADRLAIIDENGRYVGEEYTLALCLERVLAESPGGTVVTNCATSRMSQDIAERHGARLLRSAVGEANVVDMMLAEDAVFGGEGNGGPIDPRVGLVRDSFVGMAQVLELMARRRQPISRLVDDLPRYAIHKTKTSIDREKLPGIFDALQQHFPDADASRQDGLRLDWPGAWLLVRGSNTEPIVRLIAETRETEEAAGLCRAAAKVIASHCSG